MRNGFQTNWRQTQGANKKRTMMNSLMAVALVAGSALHAQSSQKVKATVPFDFHRSEERRVGRECRIGRLSDNSVMKMKSADRNHVKVCGLANGITTKLDKG